VKKFNILGVITFVIVLLISSCAPVVINSSTFDNDYLVEWNPVCRHKTVYWISVVRDQYPVRVAFGKVIDPKYVWHVQPQLKLGENWYYFEVVDDDVRIILNMPSLYEGWAVLYYMDVGDYVNWLFRTDLKESK
jgi:hypothetical protein